MRQAMRSGKVQPASLTNAPQRDLHRIMPPSDEGGMRMAVNLHWRGGMRLEVNLHRGGAIGAAVIYA